MVLAEEILLFIENKGAVTVEAIQEKFGRTGKITCMILGFLAKYGFVEYDAKSKTARLTKTMKDFFDGLDEYDAICLPHGLTN